ncbi:MAG TPA: DUF2510 domain-containing protein [Solirubrobacterales bacterium]|nr:DUF2510 domain-containing protein [Solirubrobacterales bacterium]
MAEESPAGWHPDPQDAAFLRWWDGETWTDQRKPRQPTGAVPSNDAESSEGMSGLAITGFVLAILFPIVGFLMGLAMIAGRRQHGAAVLITSIVAFMIWLAIITG